MSASSVFMYCLFLATGVAAGAMIGSCFPGWSRGDKRPVVSGIMVGFAVMLAVSVYADGERLRSDAWEARCLDELGGVIMEIRDRDDVCIKPGSILEERP